MREVARPDCPPAEASEAYAALSNVWRNGDCQGQTRDDSRSFRLQPPP